MEGHLKSRVECPDCDCVSITFDPYMFLSVPLPIQKYKVVEFTWVGEEVAKPVVYGIKVMYFSFCVAFHFVLGFFFLFFHQGKTFLFSCVTSLKLFVDA